MLLSLQKANMRAFYAKQKISLSKRYLRKANNYQTCTKQTCYIAGYPALANAFFRNRRCSSWARLTVLSKLMYGISKKISNYLQMPEYLLHFSPTIINITMFRQVDNKRFNFIINYMVHDTKLFLFFNLNLQWMCFLNILFGLRLNCIDIQVTHIF